jgi:SulP family sulfate permease
MTKCYLSDVRLTIIGSQFSRVPGSPKSMGLWEAHPGYWRWQSIVVGIVAVVMSMVLVPRIIRTVPAAIIAMMIGILVYFGLGFVDPAL